jgi:hypothetical protein
MKTRRQKHSVWSVYSVVKDFLERHGVEGVFQGKEVDGHIENSFATTENTEYTEEF